MLKLEIHLLLQFTKNKEANKIHIYSPKESSDVVFITKEARKLMEEIKKHILE